MRSLVAAILCIGLGACSSHERYFVERGRLEALAQQPEALQPEVVPAVREKDGKEAFIKTRALRYDVRTLPPGERVAVEARTKNSMMSAGAALTFIGTAISLIGTGIFAAGSVQNNGTVFTAGAATTISAEPIMLAGTILWILGAKKRPYEASVAPVVPVPPPPPPPAQIGQPASEPTSALQ